MKTIKSNFSGYVKEWLDSVLKDKWKTMKRSNFFSHFLQMSYKKKSLQFLMCCLPDFIYLFTVSKLGWQTCGIQQINFLRTYSSSLL